MHRWFVLLLFAVLWGGCSLPRGTRESSFDFALIGDVPYNEFDTTNSFPNMIAEINSAPMTFVVHNGDIKAGETPCSDELFERCYNQFQTFRQPLIYLFGDNEWSDCPKTNGHTPYERLTELRRIFCAGNESLGQRKIALERQSDYRAWGIYRENVRWKHGGVVFAGFNIPGSANNFGQSEFADRNKANIAWLEGSFAKARAEKALGIMLIMQANPHFDLGRTNKLRAGFNEFLDALERETVKFERPVVLVHGDSHYFRIDKPLVGRRSKRRIENFTRVETFGNPDVHWVRARVDPTDPNVFSFEQRIVKKNLVRH